MLNNKIWSILPIILIISTGMLAIPATSDPVILPNVTGSEPTIDGDVSSITEWQDAINFTTTVNGQDAYIQVTSNTTNLYIGLNYTSTNFIKVNNTAYSDGKNLEGHDWLALQFDNNLDQKEFGTATSPDDAVVVNQFNSSIYDSYANGNASHPYYADEKQDGTFAFVDQGNDLTYEFSKPMNGGEGADIDIKRSIFQFKFVTFTNQTSNSTTSTTTDWFTVRVNETGTGLAVTSVSDLSVGITILGDNADDYSALETTLDQFGVSAAVSVGNLSISLDDNLTVVILTDDDTLVQSQIDELIGFVELGGTAAIFVSPDAPSAGELLERFDLSFTSSPVKTEDGEEDISTTTEDLIYTTGNSVLTDRALTSLTFSSHAFNVSSTLNKTNNPYMLRQEYHSQNIFSSDGIEYDNETLPDDLSLGLSIDLLKTGRVNLFPSTALVSNDYLTEDDNMHFLLRMLPWNARMVNTIQVNSIELSTHILNETESFSVLVNATDEFGDIITDLNVESRLSLANKLVSSAMLNETSALYNGTVDTKGETGSMQLRAVVYLEGYGFAESEVQQVFIEYNVDSFNDLTELDIFVIILFLSSAAIAVYTILRTVKK